MAVQPLTAKVFEDRLKVVDGHMRAKAAVDLGLPFTVEVEGGMRVQMLKQKDGSVSGIGPGGKRVFLDLEAG
jgi:hypothetical protein